MRQVQLPYQPDSMLLTGKTKVKSPSLSSAQPRPALCTGPGLRELKPMTQNAKFCPY